MITVDFINAVFFYILIPFLFFFTIWLFRKREKNGKKNIARDENLWYCNICNYTFIDTVHSDISECPRCLSYVSKEEVDIKKQKDNSRNGGI